MIKITTSGGFKKTNKLLNKLVDLNDVILDRYLNYYGQEGVAALEYYTPKDTGRTSKSWYYEIETDKTNNTKSIVWKNTNEVHGINIAMLIQNGHSTKSGVYVSGVDYINPALQPIFQKIATDVWEVVLSL